jgi:phosphomannomutase
VGSTHIDNLAAKVRETRADLGIAFDGDGDRVLMADDQGNRSTAMTCCTSWPAPGRTKAACAARWSAR